MEYINPQFLGHPGTAESFPEYPAEYPTEYPTENPAEYPPYEDYPPSPYSIAPLMQPGFNFNSFDPCTPRPVATNYIQMFPAPEPFIPYPIFTAPPFPVYGPVQTSAPTQANQPSPRVQARKVRLGKKRQQAQKPIRPGEELSKVLSQLALESPNIPVFDIGAYVLRGPEKRIQNTRTGSKILRPLNAFLLYRKAYSDHIKAVLGTNKNGVVSSVAGRSWNAEPQIIRDKYFFYARTEKQQHLAYFPNYKHPLSGRCKTREKPSSATTDTDEDKEIILDEIRVAT
ncbi:hypothetical protein F4803DRAFT_33076 [Xylaria telfairii]|nr:hypothetical protein F4803DRAFT_33076 [Xylaria telfairii]